MDAKHPLVGKILRYDTDDGEAYMVSRFIADLGSGCMLAQRVSPHTGKDLNSQHIVFLPSIAAQEMTEIYADWDVFTAEMKSFDSPAKVVKLVPRQP